MVSCYEKDSCARAGDLLCIQCSDNLEAENPLQSFYKEKTPRFSKDVRVMVDMIRAVKPLLTDEWIEEAINTERDKAGGFLTAEAAVHLVYQNIIAKEKKPEAPAKNKSPKTKQDLEDLDTSILQGIRLAEEKYGYASLVNIQNYLKEVSIPELRDILRALKAEGKVLFYAETDDNRVFIGCYRLA